MPPGAVPGIGLDQGTASTRPERHLASTVLSTALRDK
jgi:hypothetical protein